MKYLTLFIASIFFTSIHPVVANEASATFAEQITYSQRAENCFTTEYTEYKDMLTERIELSLYCTTAAK